MNSSIGRVRRLKAITNLLADRALAPVTQAKNHVNKIETRVEALGTHRKNLMRVACDPSIAATMLGQAERLRKQRTMLLDELVKAEACLNLEKAKAAKAVGRDLVLGKLMAKQKKDERLEKLRRKMR